MTARCTAWRASCRRVAPRASLDSMANTTDMPITNTKVGNTRSVGVRPFQAACFIKSHEPLPPLLLTMIMNAIVIPRTTSRDSSLGAGSRRSINSIPSPVETPCVLSAKQAVDTLLLMP